MKPFRLTAVPLAAATLAAAALAAAVLATAAPASTSRAAAAYRPVEVTATDHAFVLPARIRGGVVRMRFRATGTEPHEFALGRIVGNHTVAQALKAIRAGKHVTWLHDVAGPPLLTPGDTIEITRILEPGRYVFLDFFPNRDGVSHAEVGLAREFTVAGATGAKLPTPDAVVTAEKSRFDVPALHPGTVTIELRNRSGGDREFTLSSLLPGKTMTDAERWIGVLEKTGKLPSLPIPFNAYGAIQSIPSGTSVYLTVTLEKGRSYRLGDNDHGIAATFTPR